MYVLDALEFHNVHSYSYRVNDQGEETIEKKDAETQFYNVLVRKLEHMGALLLKYQKFRERVPLLPLMPDKMTLQRIKEIEKESDEYYRWLQQVDQ